jgi:hypothetical protein
MIPKPTEPPVAIARIANRIPTAPTIYAIVVVLFTSSKIPKTINITDIAAVIPITVESTAYPCASICASCPTVAKFRTPVAICTIPA